MGGIELKWENDDKGVFVIEEGEVRVAEMAVGISGKNLTVYHTEVADKLKGQGVAGQLLTAMVAYARANTLKVIALCPYVSEQFKRHPEEYGDVWKRDWHGS